MGLVVVPGVARYVFNCVMIALIKLNHQVLALAGASCDADRDCDVVRAGELLVSVPCACLILTTSPCSFNLCASSTSPRGYLVCPHAFNIHHHELLVDSGLQCTVPSSIFTITRAGKPGNKMSEVRCPDNLVLPGTMVCQARITAEQYMLMFVLFLPTFSV